MSCFYNSNDEQRRPYQPEGGFCCAIIFAFLCATTAGGGIGYAIKPHTSTNLLLGGILGACGLLLLGLACGAGITVSTRRISSPETPFYDEEKRKTETTYLSINGESPA